MTQLQHSLKTLLAATAISSLLVSCAPTVFTANPNKQDAKNPNRYIPCELPSLVQNSSQSTSLKGIDIHVDGSGSMLGYIASGDSRYIQVISLLDSISLSPQIKVQHYRSGANEPQKITRNDYLKTKQSDFYTGTNPRFPKVSSQLETSITAAEQSNKLLVFVTDLDQNGADVNRLSQKIAETYFKTGSNQNAVGILGVKSEFEGKVYSTEPRIYNTFAYTGDRPFYVILLGSYENVKDYYEEMKKSKPELIKDSEFNLFYPGHLVTKPVYLDKVSELEDKTIQQPKSLNNGKVAVEVSSPPYHIVKLSKKAKESVELNYTLPFYPVDSELVPASDSIKVTPKVKFYKSSQKDFVDLPDTSAAHTAIAIKKINFDSNQLNLTATLNPKSFSEDGIYLITMDVMTDRLEDANWWKEWDWNSQKNSQDGSKTYNFLNFMQNLKRLTVQSTSAEHEQPVIGRFCYAIQKE